MMIKHWRKQIEESIDIVDIEEAKAAWIKTQGLLDEAENTMEALAALLSWVHRDWNKLNKHVLGHVLHSPPIHLSIGEHHFMEDWGIFQVDHARLSGGFQGNKLDLGMKLMPKEFTIKCFPCGDANWEFKYLKNGLLLLIGTITDELGSPAGSISVTVPAFTTVYTLLEILLGEDTPDNLGEEQEEEKTSEECAHMLKDVLWVTSVP
ncbi:hypothetical protein ID866_4673 [Astraeus odoratus]|nr:hypothetical protein ID866_4673 [Astraeus odoratus]